MISSYDTLMACFSLFLTGEETRSYRTKLRKEMMDCMQSIIFTQPGHLSETCFDNAAVRAFVNRIHSIQPNEIPKSAEVLYIRDEERFKQEATTFITQNRREGYVGDMFTFCYLFAEMYRVDVHLFHPEKVTLSAIPFAKYNIYIEYANGRFNLLLPTTHKTPEYSLLPGIVTRQTRTRIAEFQIVTLKKSLVPPNILGYRVHYQCIYDTGQHLIEPVRKTWKEILKSKEYGYIWGKRLTDNEITLLSCVSQRGYSGPRFYIDTVPFEIYLVVEENIEDAKKAILIEKK